MNEFEVMMMLHKASRDLGKYNAKDLLLLKRWGDAVCAVYALERALLKKLTEVTVEEEDDLPF